MTTFVNALKTEDYYDIHNGVQVIKYATSQLKEAGVRIEIPHEHRFWEYGSAIQTMFDTFGSESLQRDKTVLDVGAGWSPLGPALALCCGCLVTECEPDVGCRTSRVACNRFLEKKKKVPINSLDLGLSNLPPYQYDAVFCISVMEHVKQKEERQAWVELAKRVRPGGLLFMTVDCVQELGKPYTFDNLRETNYTTQMLEVRVDIIKSLGLVPMGIPDYTYRGAQVFDYTFFRLGFLKP
jgi:hypothetical protein